MRVIAGRLKGRALIAPEGLTLRPTSDRAREALFNILAHAPFIGAPLAGCRFLDAFAGSGAIGLEALSRGAVETVFMDVKLAPTRANLRGLALAGGQKATLVEADCRKPPRAPAPVDLATLDPPYRQGLAAPALVGLAAAGWIGPETVTSVEVGSRDDVFDPPPGFALLDERRYGAARLLFLRLETPCPIS